MATHEQGLSTRPLDIPEVRRLAISGAIIIAIAFAIFAAWVGFAPLSGAVIAGGAVQVDNNRKTVQHLEGGIVGEIRVRDGDRVKAGDVLMVLQDSSVDASVDLLTGQLYSETAKLARLTAERDGAPAIRFPESLTALRGTPKVSQTLKAEEQLFAVRRAAVEEQVRSLQGQIEEAKREATNLDSQVESLTKAASYLQEEVATAEKLYKENFVNRTRLLTVQRQLAETEANRSERLAELAKTRQRIGELELRILNLRTTRVQEAADGMDQTRRRVADLQERLRPSQDALRRQNVLAPVAGEIVNLKVTTVGGVITPRQPLLDIVPDETGLVVEARIGVEDIDEVRKGLPADVRLSAYSQRSTPLVKGEVVYVSADRSVDEATRVPFYVAHIRVNGASLAEAGAVRLAPGMPAEVFVRTKDRTALEYLIEPITNTLRRAARES